MCYLRRIKSLTLSYSLHDIVVMVLFVFRFNLATEAFSVTLANPPHFFREKNMQYYFKNHGRMIQVCIVLDK